MLWVYCFVFHWVLMLYLGIDQYFPTLRIHTDTPLIFGFPLLLVELVIQFNDFFTTKD